MDEGIIELNSVIQLCKILREKFENIFKEFNNSSEPNATFDFMIQYSAFVLLKDCGDKQDYYHFHFNRSSDNNYIGYNGIIGGMVYYSTEQEVTSVHVIPAKGCFEYDLDSFQDNSNKSYIKYYRDDWNNNKLIVTKCKIFVCDLYPDFQPKYYRGQIDTKSSFTGWNCFDIPKSLIDNLCNQHGTSLNLPQFIRIPPKIIDTTYIDYYYYLKDNNN